MNVSIKVLHISLFNDCFNNCWSKEIDCPPQEGHNPSSQNQEQRREHKIQGQMCQIFVHIHLWGQGKSRGDQEDDPINSPSYGDQQESSKSRVNETEQDVRDVKFNVLGE